MYELITNRFEYAFKNYDELENFLIANIHNMTLNGETIQEIHFPTMVLQYDK